MFAHRATDPLPARSVRNDEPGVCDVCTAARLIRVQSVTSGDFSPGLGNKNVSFALKPIPKSVLARNVRIERIRLTLCDHFPKNFPDRITIRIRRKANGHHQSK